MTVEKDLDDGLTDQERAALQEDDGAGEETSNDNADLGEGKENGQQEAAADPVQDADDAAKAGADTTAAAADTPADGDATGQQPAADAASQQPAPILVSAVPQDAEAKLTEIATQKDTLLEKFDSGDLTAKEYQKQLDALNKQERDLELDIREAKLADKMNQQSLQNAWVQQCNAFVESHPIYKNNQRLYQALDNEVRALAQKPESANWSGQRFLDEAHKNLKEAFGFQEANTPATRKPATQRPDLPPNLAKVPAADVQDTDGGRFAVLDRMASTDPEGYEEALMKLSQSERDAYLAQA